MGQSHPNHMAENGKGVSSTEGKPGEPGGAGMGVGQPGGCCSGPAEHWEGLAWGRLWAARRKKLQREMCRHAFLYPKGQMRH